MPRNLTDVEQRMIAVLRNDSRKTILDIAGELGISRITAKKIFNALTEDGVIKRFTITLAEDDRNLIIVHVREIEKIPQDLMVEYFSLVDGTFLVVTYYENLIKIQNQEILGVEIATRRTLNEGYSRMEHVRCDYCGNEIVKEPIKLEIHKKTFYVCCPNCERDLRKRREFIIEHGEE